MFCSIDNSLNKYVLYMLLNVDTSAWPLIVYI